MRKDPVYGAMSFDTETTSVTFGVPSILHYGNTDIRMNDVTAFGISLAIPWKDKLALFWGRLGTPLFDECCRILTVAGPKVAHNLRYDKRVCLVNSVKLIGQLHCTLTMARIHWNRRMKFGLKDLTSFIIPELEGYDDGLKRIMTNIKSSYTRAGYPKGYCNYSFIPDEDISEYSMIDAFVTWCLNSLLMPKMINTHKKVYRREKRIISIVMNIEMTGLQFDRHRARVEIKKINTKMAKIQRKLIKMAGKEFKPLSPKQLLPVLVGVGVPKKFLLKQGKYTTSRDKLEEAVTKLDKKKPKKFVKTLLQLRSCHKLNNTYLIPLYKKAMFNKGIIYCNLNPTDTRTGRMSSSDPNLQNIPRPTSGFEKSNPVRKCFICRPGYVNHFADYSQMEMWVFALTADEKRMLNNLFSGLDIHAQTAIDVLGAEAYGEDGKVLPLKRHHFKQTNFAIIYGMGFKSLAVYIDVTQMEAHDIRGSYLETYPRIVEFMDELKHELLSKGYVKDIFGRRYNIDPRKAYKAVNALVQGGCAQVLKIALINLKKYFDRLPMYGGLKARMLLLIHDELMYQLPKAMPLKIRKKVARDIEYIMGNIPQLIKRGVRLKVETKFSTKSWEDKEELFRKEAA